jgi:hypothetical protein
MPTIFLEPAVRFELTTGGLRILSLMCHLVTPDSITPCILKYQTPFRIWRYHPVLGGAKQFVGKMLATEVNLDGKPCWIKGKTFTKNFALLY